MGLSQQCDQIAQNITTLTKFGESLVILLRVYLVFGNFHPTLAFVCKWSDIEQIILKSVILVGTHQRDLIDTYRVRLLDRETEKY